MHTVSHVVWGVSKHVALAYLVYSLVQHRQGRTPAGGPTVVLLFGSLFPDVVDKPLAFAGVVGYGRGVAHSLFTAFVVIVFVVYLSHRRNHARLGHAFGIGYLSHALVDMYGPLLTGTQSMDTAFLFWPVLVEYPLGVPTPALPVSRYVLFSGILLGALCLWVCDRMPPVVDVVQFSRSRRQSGEKNPP